MMAKRSPEFRIDAFVQDITNLKTTLDALGITYHLKKTKIEIKDAGQSRNETVDIPEFPLHQFLGRVCMVIEELQAKFSPPANEGLVLRCKLHGKDIPAICIEGRAYCMQCIANVLFAGYECDWVDPEDEMPEQEEELS